MLKNNKIVVFSLDDKSFALYLYVVDRIFPSFELTPLPAAPAFYLV